MDGSLVRIHLLVIPRRARNAAQERKAFKRRGTAQAALSEQARKTFVRFLVFARNDDK